TPVAAVKFSRTGRKSSNSPPGAHGPMTVIVAWAVLYGGSTWNVNIGEVSSADTTDAALEAAGAAELLTPPPPPQSAGVVAAGCAREDALMPVTKVVIV